MIKENLEKKLKDYLEKKEAIYYQGSINYKGLRNTKMIDGSFEKYHLVSYIVSVSSQQYDSDAFYFAAFDEKTLKLKFIIGPQSFEMIEE